MKRPTKRHRPAIALIAVPILLMCASLSSGAATPRRPTIPAVSLRSPAPAYGGRLVLALLSEENLPAQEMPSPTPGAASPAPSPGAEPAAGPSPVSGEDNAGWTRLPAAGSTTPRGVPPSPTADEGIKAAGGGSAPGSAATPLSPGLASAPTAAGPTPEASPAETPPPYDVGSVQPTPPVSDQPLTGLIDAAGDQPALGASLRFAERARRLLEKSKPDDAIRTLARALSIDSSNPYAYFYLGRAYMMKKNCQQALAFFGRAEVGLRTAPAWFGEVKSYEGVCLEEQGKFVQAANDYKLALDVAPGNMTALAGYGRLSASLSDANAGNEPPPPAPNGDLALPAPADSGLVTSPPYEKPPEPALPNGQATPSDN